MIGAAMIGAASIGAASIGAASIGGLSKKFLVQIKKQENSLLCEFSCFFIKIIWKTYQKYVSC